ncbi:hybrid sensor histidine kinase/response regulator [Panacibacter sp. DH6]|uniref:histidine kinase n=1 Tax=Panacibacter microcysteis TaxID=2793269 RepID=A0A931E074_9BACT|nr:hybrid sensor histidine kinase/response regulator [Panacibacter microcysteis]MBG9375045.1 hybrid sensor histidine kinase/response regulator [Panacibacter microcysteis]
MRQDEKISVLFIDDESNNLLSFQASFRRKYKIFLANSPAEGMGILSKEQVQVIIADQRMPQTTGVEFFQIVRKAHPDPIRILLTGYTDAEAIIDAINKGEIYRYIKKPWDEFELQNAIQNAYEIYVTREKLNRKISELEKTNDELNRFVYSTSHDLRSPLASVMGILNLAKMENSVQDPNGYLGMIETCVNKMDTFIQKIIEYYKSIRVEQEHTRIDFNVLLDESIQLFKMQRPDITYNLNVDQDGVFMNDAFRMSVIIDNLISNAVKYQKPTEPNPKVEVTVKSDDRKATIKIEDNGVGILDNHLNNIFKMFFRSNNTVNGLGIGLYIVKEALTRIGGEISVHSTHGEGTAFYLQIPNFVTSPNAGNPKKEAA